MFPLRLFSSRKLTSESRFKLASSRISASPRDCNAQLYGPYKIFLSIQKASLNTGLFTSAYVKEIEISPVFSDFRQVLLPEQNKKVMMTSKSRQNGYSEMIIKKSLFDQSRFILNYTSFCFVLSGKVSTHDLLEKRQAFLYLWSRIHTLNQNYRMYELYEFRVRSENIKLS